jgi:aryl-alcohol dehydrogenase-like predicted oxidoreductase
MDRQTVQLGENGPIIPALGIGTWAWGDQFFWSYGQEYDHQALLEAFNSAVESGINFFDTAEVYGLGKSEKLLGEFLRQSSQQVHIATKYFPLPWRTSSQTVHETLTASLNRLGVEQIALYQVHWPFDFLLGQPKLMSALAEEVKQGRILTVGVSNYSAEQTKRAHDLLAKEGVPLVVNQVCYSLLNRKIESNGVLETANELKIKILAYSPLAQGLLTGKYNIDNYQSPKGARRLSPNFSKSGLKKIEPLLNLLQELSQKYQRTSAQISLNWLIIKSGAIPIPGAKNSKQSTQNAGALGWALESDDITLLDELTLAYL